MKLPTNNIRAWAHQSKMFLSGDWYPCNTTGCKHVVNVAPCVDCIADILMNYDDTELKKFKRILDEAT